MFVAIVAAAFRLAYLTCALHAAFAAAGFAITSLGMSLGAMASVG